MTPFARKFLFLVFAPGLSLVVLLGMRGLQPFGVYVGPYGDVLNAVAVAERHATNIVTAVNFDYRGFDTLGEEFILFAAVAGVGLILRDTRGEEPSSRPEGDYERVARRRGEAVQWGGLAMVAAVNLFGAYIIIHAAQTPGGGFQGGAILGTGSILAYLAGGYATYRRVVPKVGIEVAEALGGGTYALIGFVGVVAGGGFLHNFLPLGKAGDLLSAGTIPVINLAVGLEVAAGFAMLFAEFLEETRQPESSGESR